jgi:hypothetical protein
VRLAVDDNAIREAINGLTRRGARITARSLRAELKRRFGRVGNSVRVHRHLQIQRAVADREDAPDAKLRAELALVVADANAWKRRAELAEHRERAHQDKWAMEIHQLREALRAARAALPTANARSDEYLKLYNDRERLKSRVVELERRLSRAAEP